MDDKTLQAIIQVGGFILLLSGGGLLAWRAFFVNKRKIEAEVRSVDAQAQNTLALVVANLGVEVARLTRDLDEERQKRRNLENEVESMKDEHATIKQVNANLRKGVRVLSKQLVANELVPEWTLPD